MPLTRRFEGKGRNSIFEKLARLKQEGCMEDYILEKGVRRDIEGLWRSL